MLPSPYYYETVDIVSFTRLGKARTMKFKLKDFKLTKLEDL